MATGQNQGAELYFGQDIAVKNYGLLDIAEGTGVLLDASNLGGVSGPPGVINPTSSGGVAGTFGVATTAIAAGKIGTVRMAGTKWMTASGTVTALDLVQISDTSAKMGYAKTAAGSGTELLGKAMTTATDGLPVLVFICPFGKLP